MRIQSGTSLLGGLLAAALVAPSASALEPGATHLILDGTRVEVSWTDGDSFTVKSTRHEGEKTRIVGYNTLESYGPVHYWGGFNGWDLYRNAKKATKVAQSKTWECHRTGSKDGYGRSLVECPGLMDELLRRGLAHIFAIGEDADPDDVVLQRRAQADRNGMWAEGIPAYIVTSVHSITEDQFQEEEEDAEAYNRVVNTRTGKSDFVHHRKAFEACDTFCHGGSCMIYLPFERRYGDDRPDCVAGEYGDANKMGPPPHLDAPIDPYPSYDGEEPLRRCGPEQAAGETDGGDGDDGEAEGGSSKDGQGTGSEDGAGEKQADDDEDRDEAQGS